jgi:uncharacterized membrane protein HdeD (DUF308 family)
MTMETPANPSWWALVLRGAAALVFGVLALAWPGITLLVLVALFAAYALISGVAAVVGAIRARATDRRWWLVLLLGLVSVAAGVLAVFVPAITALALVLLMGANALVSGVLEIVMAVRLRQQLRGEWLLGLAGLLSIVFGTLVLLFPGPGALALVWLIAVWAIAIGILLIAAGFSLRKRTRAAERPFEGTPRHA